MQKYKLHALTRQDLKNIIAYYENEMPGLGRAFYADFKKTVELICSHPRMGVAKEHGIRKFSLRRFRYDLFYFVKDDQVYVGGVLHQHRDPAVM